MDFDKVEDQMNRIVPYYKVKELVDRVLKESEMSTKGRKWYGMLEVREEC